MSLAAELQSVLSDVVTLYFKAQGCHWNVEGPDFSQYHDLFGAIYADVYDSIDPLAENVRKLGAYSPFTLEAFLQLRTLTDSEIDTTPVKMAVSLLSDNEHVITRLNLAFQVASDENQQGIADFIAGRIDMHQKWSWQLRASTK